MFDAFTAGIFRSIRTRSARKKSAELRARLFALLGGESGPVQSALTSPRLFGLLETLPNLDEVAVDRTPLLEREVRAVGRALRELPDFPQNAFNGCQSRAHVTYLRLAAAAPGKLHKVWLFTEQLISPTATSSIDFVVPGSRTSHWNYHVAVAYTAPDGQTMVIDRLTSMGAQTLESWVHRFVYRGAVAITFTSGRRYSFYVAPRTVRGISGNVLDGFFDYTGITKRSRDGAKAIAADALAAAFSNGDCARCEWSQYRADTISLVAEIAPYLPVPTWSEAVAAEWAEHSAGYGADELESASSPLVTPERDPPPLDCEEAFDLFSRQLRVWSAMGL
jgi:hypothetical protein